jgi:hypothetical protein
VPTGRNGGGRKFRIRWWLRPHGGQGGRTPGRGTDDGKNQALLKHKKSIWRGRGCRAALASTVFLAREGVAPDEAPRGGRGPGGQSGRRLLRLSDLSRCRATASGGAAGALARKGRLDAAPCGMHLSCRRWMANSGDGAEKAPRPARRKVCGRARLSAFLLSNGRLRGCQRQVVNSEDDGRVFDPPCHEVRGFRGWNAE